MPRLHFSSVVEYPRHFLPDEAALRMTREVEIDAGDAPSEDFLRGLTTGVSRAWAATLVPGGLIRDFTATLLESPEA